MSSLSQKSQSLLIWLLALSVIVNLIINYLWREQLYSMGLDIISHFQRPQSIFLTTFFAIPTTLIDPGLIIAGCFVALIRVKQKSTIINAIIWILLNAFGSCLLKAFYADPRPFWSRQDIESLGLNCPQQYGNPSGHSWFSVTVGFGLLAIHAGPGQNYKNLYISLALIILVPISRMYLGAHSLNQVMQGLFFGFVMVILYKFCGFREKIQTYLQKFHSSPGHKWKKTVLCFHLIYIIGFVINLNQYNPYLEPIPENWAQNIIDECRKSTPPHHLNFTMLMLNSLIVNFATGLGWGFESMSSTGKGKIYLSGNWIINQQRYALWVGYFMLVFIQAGLLLIGFLPCALAVYFLGPTYLVLFVFGNIGSFLAGFLYTSKSFAFLFDKEVIRQQIN